MWHYFVESIRCFKGKNWFCLSLLWVVKPQNESKLTKIDTWTVEPKLTCVIDSVREEQIACHWFHLHLLPKHIPSNIVSSYLRRKKALKSFQRAPASFVFLLWSVVLTARTKMFYFGLVCHDSNVPWQHRRAQCLRVLSPWGVCLVS